MIVIHAYSDRSIKHWTWNYCYYLSNIYELHVKYFIIISGFIIMLAHRSNIALHTYLESGIFKVSCRVLCN